MKIGLISDTHNEIERTKKAIKIFVSRNVDIIIHAGDISSPKIIELFKNLKCQFVLGNSDDVDTINRETMKLGFGCIEDRCEFEVDGKRILVIHGNVVSIFREAVASGKYDYIIKGHTHIYEDYCMKNTRIINPGSVHDENEKSIAILFTEKDQVEKIELS